MWPSLHSTFSSFFWKNLFQFCTKIVIRIVWVFVYVFSFNPNCDKECFQYSVQGTDDKEQNDWYIHVSECAFCPNFDQSMKYQENIKLYVLPIFWISFQRTDLWKNGNGGATSIWEPLLNCALRMNTFMLYWYHGFSFFYTLELVLTRCPVANQDMIFLCCKSCLCLQVFLCKMVSLRARFPGVIQEMIGIVTWYCWH